MLPPNGERRAGPATHWLSCSDERDIHADASRTPSLPVPSWSQCATCLDESLDELVRGRNVRGLLRADAHITFATHRTFCDVTNETTGTGTGKKTPGEPGHTRPVQYPHRHRRRRLQVPRLTSYTIFDPVVVNWSWCVRRSVYKYCDSSGHLRVRDDISVANPKSLRSSQRRIRTMHTGTIGSDEGCNDTG